MRSAFCTKHMPRQTFDKRRSGFLTTGVQVTTATDQPDRTATAASGSEDHHPLHIQARDSGLFLIGIFKLLKAVFFLSISLGALHFVHHDLTGSVARVIRILHFDAESHFVDLLMEKVGQITHHKLRLISMGTSLYAALCLTEAYGLLTRKVWAEFVTLWLSVSFLPWEIYELSRRPSSWHVGILLANLAIVAYLLWLLRRKKARTPAAP